MKTTKQTLLVVLMLLAISCKKENAAIQTSGTAVENSTQTLLPDNSERSSRAVKIGTQVWSRENLSVRYYRNGDKIPQEKDPVKWAALKTGAWCWYNNDSITGHIYGRLYNSYAVNDPRGLAPEGWHIPSDAEWETLSTFLGIRAGGKMKATGTVEGGTGLWYAPNKSATNRSGFTGLPGGSRGSDGSFYDVGRLGSWWSSQSGDEFEWYRSLDYSDGEVFRGGSNGRDGFSVRCLKD